MTRLSRLLTAAAALTLIALFFLPLWKVALEAPQYPEGIGMYIAISDIRGFDEFDLDKINNLNHYIGMQRIEPESFPELRYMPWILGVLVAAGFAVAALGKRRLLHAWIAVLVVAGAVGLADFYKWGYEYGHNLDDTAIIKVPGMAYQPPVIGRKQLLNFTAASWPAAGGLLGGFAFVLALGAAYHSRRRKGPAGRRAVAGVALAAAACTAASVQPIHYDGTETCAYCSMAITDRRFGAEVVTTTGKAHKFDSIECLAAYVAQDEVQSRIKSVWVTDYSSPGTLTEAQTARYVHDADGPSSPMGFGLRAYAAGSPAPEAGRLDWSGVLQLVAQHRAAPPGMPESAEPVGADG